MAPILWRARWVLPVASRPIRDGAVAVENGRITWVGPAVEAPPGTERDTGDALLVPGLVNAHTHLDLTGFRGLLEGLDFFAWIRTLSAAKREVTDAETLLDFARLGIVEGLHAGITAYGDTTDADASFLAMRELGVRGVAFLEVFGPDPAVAATAVADLAARAARLRTLSNDRLRIGVSPHAPYSVSDALYTAVARLAAVEGYPIAVHIAESEAETRLVVEGEGPFADFLRGRGIAVAPRASSPIALLQRTGVLAQRPLLIHAIRADLLDRTAAANAGCRVAHCPCSNAKLGHGIAPLREWLDAVIPVGLGTDSMASNNRMHLLEEARSAALQQAARLGRPDAVTARELLRAATLGGAQALGIDADVGSIERGKAADLAAFPLGRLVGAADLDPEAAAVYALGGTPASVVLINGEVRVLDGRMLSEPPGLVERTTAAAARLVQWRRARVSG